VEPVWLMIAERNSWPGGNNSEFCGRRSEGMTWCDTGNWKQVQWKNDTRR
ncbi:MAG: hypothetical protein HQL46_16795, partial [Gammaproteobacteria bacterium]|nr:hypothetical protein [Gammaproteobacteria bacterium]